MIGNEKMQSLFRLQAVYEDLFENYRNVGVEGILDKNDKENTESSQWHLDHYFDVGIDALRIVVEALIKNKLEPPRKILDFPSGSGRVTRHLKAFFPEASIVACDLYQEHVAFCESALGVKGVISKARLSDVKFDEKFDLIFCGSLLTHLPESKFVEALDLMERSLSDRGIAIATLQGRHSLFVQGEKWKYIEDELFDVAKKEFEKHGFGYVDYAYSFKSKFDQQENYGVTLCAPNWILKDLEARPSVRILGYFEREWDDHQDVVVFGRPKVNV